MTAAGPFWQSSGVCFQATRRPLSPLLEADGPPELLFDVSLNYPWSDADWAGAELVGQFARNEGDEPVEIRRAGARFLFHAPWAGFLAIEPGRVVGRALRRDTLLSLEMEFLEQALAIHLGLKGVPVFHAAAVEISGAAVALIAESGGGKSSLTIGLVQAGCGFLSDDLVAVHGDERLVYPGHMNLRLHPDTARALLGKDHYRLINPFFDDSKLVTDVSAWGRIQKTPCPLAAIYIVEARPGLASAHIERLPPAQALQQMVNSQVGHDNRTPAERFAVLASLVRNIPVRRLVLPRSFPALPPACATLMDDVRRLMASCPS